MMRSSVVTSIVTLLAASLFGCVTYSSTDASNRTQPLPRSALSVTPDYALSQVESSTVTTIDAKHTYSLDELIALAQHNNPATRIAWQEAEQAATAAGMVKATYLPMLSASVLGGYQRSKRHTQSELTNLPLDVEIDTTNHSHISGIVPALTMEWLLFDFGKRAALQSAAKELATASRVKFTGAHQAVIFNVSRTFFEYSAARENTKLAAQHLENSLNLTNAAQARFRHGVATSIEVAQAKQLAAQAKLAKVQTKGVEQDAYQALLSAIGLPPTAEIQIADTQGRTLPHFSELPNDELLKKALAYRPDLLAVDAARKAAEKGVDSAQANYMPKVALLGVAASGNANFNLRGVGEMSPHSSSQAILLGVTLPLFDGGLRRMQVQEAESRAMAAQELVRKTQQDALKEMHFAVNALRSALEAYEAASELVEAATLTHDAAQEAYKVGVGNMMLATQAANGLLDAAQAKSLAYAGALIASANLAFMMGQMNQAPAS